MKGIYERVKGSGKWWIRWTDGEGKLHREVAGTKSAAAKLYQLRKAAILEGRKIPVARSARTVTFKEIADAALAYSKNRNRSWKHDQYRIAKLTEEFGHLQADLVTPGAIEGWLHRHEWGAGTRNRYRALITGTYKRALEDKRIESKSADRDEVGFRAGSQTDSVPHLCRTGDPAGDHPAQVHPGVSVRGEHWSAAR